MLIFTKYCNAKDDTERPIQILPGSIIKRTKRLWNNIKVMLIGVGNVHIDSEHIKNNVIEK